MSRQKDIPYVPLHFFLRHLPRPGRQLFYLLFGLFVVAGVLMAVGYHFPEAFTVEMLPVSDSRLGTVQLEQVEHQYREMNIIAKAYYNFTSFAATTIEPNVTWMLVQLLLMSAGWAALLTASSGIKGYFGYAPYVLFGAHIFFGRVAYSLFGTDPLSILSLLIILLFIAPAYMMRVNMFQLDFRKQFGFFLLLQILLYSVLWAVGGLAEVHRGAVFAFPVQAFVAVLFLFMVSKDLGQLMVFAANNHPTEKQRRPAWLLFTLLGLVFLTTLFLALQYNGLLPMQSYFLRPLHLVLLAGLFSVFLAQNAYHQVNDIIPENTNYNVLILGLGLLAFSFFGYHFGQTEYSLIATTDRIAANLFTLMLLGQLAYIGVNFMPRIRNRQLFYYLLYKPRVFRFYAIWAFVLASVFLVEFTQQLTPKMGFTSTYFNMIGDNLQLRQDFEGAQRAYDRATVSGFGDVKGNYNSAQLLIRQQKSLRNPKIRQKIVDQLSAAQRRFPFRYAALNNANLGLLLNNPQAAIQRTRRSLARHPDPYVYTNLASIYYHQNEPDSAILALKAALDLRPAMAEGYSNLSTIYVDNNKLEVARQMIAEAYELEPDNTSVLENYYYFLLAFPDARFGDDAEPSAEIELDESQIDTTEVNNYAFTLNMGLLAYREGKVALADSIGSLLTKQQETGEALLLKLVTQLERDSIQNVKSRLAWLDEYYEENARLAHHNVAVFYFKQGVPEMAAEYFRRAVSNETPEELINVAMMEADAGNLERAYKILSDYVANYDNTFTQLARREMNMIDFAAGTDPQYLSWDFKNISPEEALLMGRYSGSTERVSRAVTAFEFAVEQDSSDIRPYVELARIALQFNEEPEDRFALEQLQFGYKQTGDKDNFEAKVLEARVLIRLKQLDDARQLIDDLKEKNTNYPELRLARAEYHFAKGNPERALALYRELITQDPYKAVYYLGAGAILLQQKQYEEGHELLGRAIRFNNRNAQLWAMYAEFARGIGMNDDAVESLKIAYDVSVNEQQRSQMDSLLNVMQTSVDEETSIIYEGTE